MCNEIQFLGDFLRWIDVEYVVLRSSVIGKLNETKREIVEELEMADGDGMRVKDLASSLDKSKGHISDQVSDLEMVDLVEKRVADDGRQRVFLGDDIRFLKQADFPR